MQSMFGLILADSTFLTFLSLFQRWNGHAQSLEPGKDTLGSNLVTYHTII
jgi:hypothetical protein